MAFFEKLVEFLGFNFQIVPGGAGADLNLFQRLATLTDPLFLEFFLQLIAVFIEAEDADYRRFSGSGITGSHFNEIEVSLARQLQRGGTRQNPKVLSGLINDEQFGGGNAFVNFRCLVDGIEPSRRLVECKGKSLKTGAFNDDF